MAVVLSLIHNNIVIDFIKQRHLSCLGGSQELVIVILGDILHNDSAVNICRHDVAVCIAAVINIRLYPVQECFGHVTLSPARVCAQDPVYLRIIQLSG